MFFDYRRDALEQHPLPESALTAAQLATKRKLQHVLDTLQPAGERHVRTALRRNRVGVAELDGDTDD